jgi:hypothetical protein
MRHRSASTRRDQFFETVESQPTNLSQLTSRQVSALRACKPVCRWSESVGSLLGLWLIDTWSEPS